MWWCKRHLCYLCHLRKKQEMHYRWTVIGRGDIYFTFGISTIEILFFHVIEERRLHLKLHSIVRYFSPFFISCTYLPDNIPSAHTITVYSNLTIYATVHLFNYLSYNIIINFIAIIHWVGPNANNGIINLHLWQYNSILDANEDRFWTFRIYQLINICVGMYQLE